ncbi:NPC intracellular cholesterol transporter 2 [Magallana gigas]|uniref:MD-2-related lipid-recognition domain-containing protein n=2 Tax=Magallana gigas TaxID=29159 RepID=A0A8W8IQG0_MAGGI|nr:NPC intracellular cholesterol transporter 2-like [Crassostrea gigas]|eukprot:XP_011432442.1 PREDICTED: epididymal secretory protein E1-like [Crassostrea gigas]
MSAKVVIFLVIIYAADEVSSTVFKDCGSVSGKISSVDVSGCTTEPCIFYSGTNETLTANFTSNVVSNKPTTVITGIISNLPVPFPAEKDTCAHQTQCPIQAGKQSVFTITLPVLKSYPHISLLVKGEVRDDNGKDIMCFVFPAQIKPKD